MLQDVEIWRNDQQNALIAKGALLGLTSVHQHLDWVYISGMQAIAEKVQTTVEESSDYAVSLIMSNLNFTGASVHDSDHFLTASSSSTIGIYDTNITNIMATSKVIQIITSTLEVDNLEISNVTYDMTLGTTTFSKIFIVSKSTFVGSRLLLQNISGPLLQVSTSTFDIRS
mmetsp:Transcript_10414/g.10446  ORF Transcript_10414/g.10446 Transcript_10414/m.10446 type:complete len:171 (-) Transcript_10414:2729-3241(-)